MQTKCQVITSSFARSATSPSFAYVSNPAPYSSLCRAAAPRLRSFSCCTPIASIRFKLLFPVSVRFSCCPPIASLQLLLATCVRFSCSSPISTAPRLRPLRLLLPDCVRFNCCSPIASASTAAPRLRPLVASPVLEDSSPCPMFSNVFRRVRGSVH